MGNLSGVKHLDQIEEFDTDFKNISFFHFVTDVFVNVYKGRTELFHNQEPSHVFNIEVHGVCAIRLALVYEFAEAIEVGHLLEDADLLLEHLESSVLHELDHKVTILPYVILVHYLIGLVHLTELTCTQALDQAIHF